MTEGIEPPLGPGDAVLFDMDGTLLFLPVDIDSLRQRLERFHQRYGLQMPFRPLSDDLSRAAQQLQQSLGKAEAKAAIRWAQAEVERAEVDAAEDVRPRRGVIDALHELSRRGVALGVVSNNTRRGIRAALQGVGIDEGSMMALVSREDVPRPKPAADAVELAIRRLLSSGWDPPSGADPGRWLFVGDGPSDVIAARSAQVVALHRSIQPCRVVIIGGGRAGSGSLAGPDVDHLVADDEEALQLLVG